MDFGMFSLMQRRDPKKPSAQSINEVIEQTQLAEKMGFTASWFAEHHFSNYALCPSPLLLCAAVARATTTIRVATGVVLLPLYRPARLVSEIAFVDAISGGRLVLGVGSGYQPYEFERFGEDLKESKAKTLEFLDIIEKGLSEDFFSHDGDYYHLPETHISTRPTGAMEIWMAGDNPILHGVAAKKGYGALIGGKTGGLETVLQQRQWCMENFAAEGVSEDKVPFAVQRHMCITNDPKVAERYAENVLYQTRLTTSLRRRSESMEGTMLMDRPFPDEPSIEAIQKNLMIGAPERVAEMLAAEIKALTPKHMCFHFQVGDFPHADALRSIELFATEVVPRVEAEVGPLADIGVTMPRVERARRQLAGQAA
ncbi:LLM class flavin-dependent oxidoreductase [Oceanicola sp. 22II-s10i]|uniref:LLM class flavin-dependent oxidoreductase n=1 Tax=Oceanicola sp. 22II-s10i TaxID=1317116 RepID=UPI000B5210CF|nr:LLM class flavin-dependent oxidoreductase [Oceanicola sp. 22II-s10i]